jgi:hypothetical protein
LCFAGFSKAEAVHTLPNSPALPLKKQSSDFAAFEAAHLSMLDFFSDLLQPISCRI